MNQTDVSYASEKTAQLKSDFLVDIFTDWGDNSGTWNPGYWMKEELDTLHDVLSCFADCVGGPNKFKELIGGATVKKSDLGSHGGEALAHRVSLSTKGSFTPWTVVHEFGHAWDANHGWKLSRMLEQYTGGHTNLIESWILKLLGKGDAGLWKYERIPGRYGRMPGFNTFGYFYGDKPSGSDWNFNRKEDFAECVAMYVGWERNNDLSDHAKKRIIHYEMKNGDKDGFGEIDNWADYAKYFYPENGDYQKTRRWQFIDQLVKGKLNLF